MSELNIGVVGYGLRGGLSRHAHKPGEGSRVTALYDPDPAAHDRFRDVYGTDVATVSDLQEFAKLGLDAVFVLSPDWLHEEHAIAMLEAGAAVYLEKPMAITTEGCDRILQTAQRLNGKLYLGHNMRHMPFVRGMKRLIDDGAIGEP
jgi:predicted dehydrogenase